VLVAAAKGLVFKSGSEGIEVTDTTDVLAGGSIVLVRVDITMVAVTAIGGVEVGAASGVFESTDKIDVWGCTKNVLVGVFETIALGMTGTIVIACIVSGAGRSFGEALTGIID
jgi:hypothetical protein